jgi:hypothetical protein
VRTNRFEATVRHHVESQRAYEVDRIITNVFKKHGFVGEHEPIADPELVKKITWEASRRQPRLLGGRCAKHRRDRWQYRL